MAVRLKPVEEQVIVIVGASSGIGLSTARAAADRGAKLVLVARNGEALDEIVKECEAKGTKAVAVAADAANRDDLLRVEEEATRAFGGFDTWINNAAVAVYGTVERDPAGGPAAAVRRELLGRGLRLADRRADAQEPRRRDHQHRQRALGARHDLPGPVLRLQACRQSLHGRAAHGAGARGRPGLGDADQALGHRHPLHGARPQLPRRAGGR